VNGFHRWTLKDKEIRECIYRSASFNGQSQFDPSSVQIRLQRWSQFRHLRNGKLQFNLPLFGRLFLLSKKCCFSADTGGQETDVTFATDFIESDEKCS
jgi:hypothetical protein